MRKARRPSVRAPSVLARDIALGTLQGESQVGVPGKEGGLQGRGGPVSSSGVWTGQLSVSVNPLPLSPRQVTPSKVTQRETERGTRWGKGVLTGERGDEGGNGVNRIKVHCTHV